MAIVGTGLVGGRKEIMIGRVIATLAMMETTMVTVQVCQKTWPQVMNALMPGAMDVIAWNGTYS